MKKLIMVLSMSALLFTACKKDDDENQNALNEQDKTFVLKAGMSNYAEITAGQLAQSKGADSLVRAFGKMMVDHHTTAQNDLKSRAALLGLTVKDSIDQEHVALMQYLNQLSGYQFDTTYINSQIIDHIKAISLFEAESSNGINPSLRGYALDYLPNLNMHKNTADSIRQVL